MTKKKVIKSKPKASKPNKAKSAKPAKKAAKKPSKPVAKNKPKARPVAKAKPQKKAAPKKAAPKKPVASKVAPKKAAPKKEAPKKAAPKKPVVAAKPVVAPKPVAKKPVAPPAPAVKESKPAPKAEQKPAPAPKPSSDAPRPVALSALAPARVAPKPAAPVNKSQDDEGISKIALAQSGGIRYADKDLKDFEELILVKLKQARTDLEELRQSLSHGSDNSTDDTSPTFKMMEDGSDTMSREEVAQLAARQEKFITALENALLRIKNKTYGICRVTGKLIPKERLRLVPHATLSIEAKNMQQ